MPSKSAARKAAGSRAGVRARDAAPFVRFVAGVSRPPIDASPEVPTQDVVRIDVPVGSLSDRQRLVLATVNAATRLRRADGRIETAELARDLGVSGSALASTLDSLASARGLLRYQADVNGGGWELTELGVLVDDELAANAIPF